MLLKRLVLQGYKTFAVKTEFVFDDGVTAIVGPNGSGKSNVADALRWVLGEQSFRTLRGRQTTDMIFAGSRGRARAGMAQVTLTLDNSGGWLPIDYSEVEIGRRAYRSGENDYLINGNKVRLRDVHELLATSGLAERTYTMIGQGLIDKALSLKAEERRALFEEAAGISHYKARRAESLRRLTETQRNLQRVQDILSEIKPRLNSLKRQANRARNYEQVAVDLRELLRIWYGFQWQQARSTYESLREQSSHAEERWLTARRHLIAQQETIGTVRLQVNQFSQEIQAKDAARDMVRAELEESRRTLAVLSERQQLTERQLKEVEQELPRLEEIQNQTQTDLAEAVESLTTAQGRFDSATNQLLQYSIDFEGQQEAIDTQQRRIKEHEQQIRQLAGQVAEADGRLSQLQERLADRESEASDDQGDSSDAKARVATLTKAFEEAEAALKEVERQRKLLRQQRQEQQSEVKKLQRSNGDMNRQLNQLGKQVARLEAQRDTLDQMRQTALKVPKEVAISGRLAAGLEIPSELRPAIEAALGERISLLLVENEASLWQLVNQLDARQELVAINTSDLQAAILQPLPKDEAIVGRGSDLLSGSSLPASLLQLLLGHVVVTSDDEAAYRIGKALSHEMVAVSQSGLLVHAGGLVVKRRTDGKSSLLAREDAWRAAAEQVEVKQKELTAQQEAYDKDQETLRAKQATLAKTSDDERTHNQQENEASRLLSARQRELDRARQALVYIEKQTEKQVAETGRLRTRITQLEASKKHDGKKQAALEKELQAAQAALAALPVAESKQQRQTLQQQVESVQTIVAGRQAVVDSRRTTLNQIDAQLSRQKERFASLTQQQKELDLPKQNNHVNQLTEALASLDNDLKPLRTALSDGQKQIGELEEALVKAQKQTHGDETTFTELKIKQSQHESHVDGLRARIKSDLGLVDLTLTEDQPEQSPLPIAEVVEKLPDIDELPSDIEDSIQNYRSQLQRMGGVNPDAPVEYEEIVERHDFLIQQVDDLNQTEKQLRTVIAELDELTSRAFVETVEKVNNVFGTTFAQLFGGGTAELTLTDPDDLTVTGVDIIAQLPRRRQQGLGLLSGGERSLTAAALIFSLLKVSPTPFCVMDEVDAMLDEANVNRFRDLLRELSIQTQFIVITHNRGTVQAAQTVYGISMGGDSTSQVISIKPEEYINAQEML